MICCKREIQLGIRNEELGMRNEFQLGIRNEELGMIGKPDGFWNICVGSIQA